MQILWKELIDEWRLSKSEADYIDRQQGLHCSDCQVSFRSMALATAVMRAFGFRGLFTEFVKDRRARNLSILEVNEAGGLTRYLQLLPKRVLATFPNVDMMALPYADATYDLVIHSDTLEHVPRPIRGLSECRRVLKSGGYCAFTIPIVVDRQTIAREGLSPSYHGTAKDNLGDYLVHTEYGADAWKHVILAGFPECRIVALEYPAALGLIAVN
jgi:SAM-dependent methyltransferase